MKVREGVTRLPRPVETVGTEPYHLVTEVAPSSSSVVMADAEVRQGSFLIARTNRFPTFGGDIAFVRERPNDIVSIRQIRKALRRNLAEIRINASQCYPQLVAGVT